MLASSSGADRGEPTPWRLDDLLPERISLSFQTRLRYEYLFSQYRAGTTGDADILVLRTLLHGRVRATDWLTFGAEVLDARAYYQQILVSTGIVNTFELLQGYAELRAEWPFGGSSTLRGGRITMDVGSRRLVARNRFRNTINGFTGLDWQWRGEGQRQARAFYVLPVQRRPFLPAETADNKVRFDRESLDVQFWGLFASDALPGGHRGELYLFGLHEDDSDRRPTLNRDLVTPGIRIWKPPSKGRLDYQLESVLQFGQSRATRVSLRDLDHFAHFQHLEVGWSFDAPASPRLLAQFDYASGDRDPTTGATAASPRSSGRGASTSTRPAAPAAEAARERHQLREPARLLAGGEARRLGRLGPARRHGALGQLPGHADRAAGALGAAAREPAARGWLRAPVRRRLSRRRAPVERSGGRDLPLHPGDAALLAKPVGATLRQA